jgi:hypothetical protein
LKPQQTPEVSPGARDSPRGPERGGIRGIRSRPAGIITGRVPFSLPYTSGLDVLKIKLRDLEESHKLAMVEAEEQAFNAQPPAKENGDLDRERTAAAVEAMGTQIDLMQRDQRTAEDAGGVYNFKDKLIRLKAKQERYRSLLEGRDPTPEPTTVTPLDAEQMHRRERLREIMERLKQLDVELRDLRAAGAMQGWQLTPAGLRDLADLEAERAALVAEELRLQYRPEDRPGKTTVAPKFTPAAPAPASTAPVEVGPQAGDVQGQGPDVAQADPGIADKEHVLTFLAREQEARGIITVRSVMRWNNRRFPTREAALELLALLVRSGDLEWVEQEDSARLRNPAPDRPAGP